MDVTETIDYFQPHFPFPRDSLCWGPIVKESSSRGSSLHLGKGFFASEDDWDATVQKLGLWWFSLHVLMAAV